MSERLIRQRPRKVQLPAGFLSGLDLRYRVPDLLRGAYPEQVELASIDLTLEGIYTFSSGEVENETMYDFFNRLEREARRLEFDDKRLIHLPQGAYLAKFKERKRQFDGVAFLFPRSTLFRLGCTIDKLIFDCRESDDTLFSMLTVVNPYGVRFEKNARVAQLAFYVSGTGEPQPFPSPQESVFNLTVGRIFKFAKEGTFGVERRDVDIYEEILENKVDYSDGSPYLVEFSPSVAIPLDEFWVATTKYLAGPLTVDNVGGLGDPGFQGKWRILVVNRVPMQEGKLVLSKGQPIPGFYLRKYPIKPIPQSMAYKGRYQSNN